jgi:hypothetical protein
MSNFLDKIKKYINAVVYNVKKVFPLNDNLDNIIKREYKNAFKILNKCSIIEYVKRKYRINYKKPKLVILEVDSPFIESYNEIFNYIKVSKPSIEKHIATQLKFLGHKEIEKAINYQLKSLGYKEIERYTNDIQDIEYLIISYNSIFFYPAYINKKNKKTIRGSIAKAIVDLAIFHEFWHSIDRSILLKLVKDPTIKDISNLIITSTNLELRASAFEVIMYYLASGLYKDKKGYIAAYANIPICKKYIERMAELQNDNNKNKYVPYDLGFCYGNIIVAKYRSSLDKNIHKIIDDIIHLDKKRAIEVIKHYI